MAKGYRKINHLAIVGFLLPFVANAVVAILVVVVKKDFSRLKFLLPYFSVVPLILCCGVFCSIRSIPLIEERNDKDYAYSGLVLNIFFLVIYGISLLYFLGFTF
ncbi:MAG: hypothetical protein JRI39_09035 [Deltaproteobacteria bacterium]|nr:hypothetical protein [Deltaproteobacteria bacterium]MBW2083216.1 hypothetical protein [Deltaproteobacteria bacterium]HDM10253.1 hypothetical protein [Desulfobacteraceae bacterium]